MNLSQIAINSVSTRQSGLEEALQAYAAAGFTNVEFVLPLVKTWLAQGHTVEDARRLLAEHGLRSIGGFESGVQCFGSEEERRANHALVLANVALIDALGGGTLVVGTDGPAQPSFEALDAMAAVFRELARQIEGRGVKIAIEFNWSPFIKSLQSAVLVAEKVGHPQIGVLFDPAHYHCTPSKMEHLDARAVSWIRHVHLDDMRDKPGELSHCNDDRVLPGEGILDLREMLARLERHGYEGFYSIEMFNADLWQLPAAEAARRCYASLLPFCSAPDSR
ncbi:MAG TPA: sugar phosphate isomerase/epimerase family protein [Chthonomonadaceae bacterium]|nr:sugar phosphate isomerase/epimerase family protein [Chthonomonadaceae bacterium]